MWAMSVAAQGRGSDREGWIMHMREVVEGLSGPRGGLGLPKHGPTLPMWAMSVACSRVRLGLGGLDCAYERGCGGPLRLERGFGGSLGMAQHFRCGL